MKATEAKLLEFLKKSPQFVIPIYQRTYSWTERPRTAKALPSWPVSVTMMSGYLGVIPCGSMDASPRHQA